MTSRFLLDGVQAGQALLEAHGGPCSVERLDLGVRHAAALAQLEGEGVAARCDTASTRSRISGCAVTAAAPVFAIDAEALAERGVHAGRGDPFEAVAAGALRAQLDRVDDVAAGVQDLDLDAVGRPRSARSRPAPGRHRWPASASPASTTSRPTRLAPCSACICTNWRFRPCDRAVQLLDAVTGVDLRHLARDLRVVHRVQRVLVLHLRDQQLEEAVLGAGVVARRGGGGAGVVLAKRSN